MKTKTFTTILPFLLLLSFTALSQKENVEISVFEALDTFDIKQYSLPDLEYRNLDVGGALYSSSGNYQNSIPSFSYSSEGKIIDLTGDVWLRYYKTKNSLKSQIQNSQILSTGLRYNKSDGFSQIDLIDSSYSSKIFSIRPDYRSSYAAKFFSPGKWFFKISYEIDARMDRTTGVYTTPPYNSNYIYANIAPGFGFGKGRVEEVTDYWHTIRMLKDLQRAGVLSHIPSSEEMSILVKSISKIRNNRVLDYRLKRKEDIRLLAKTLDENKLITDKSIDYYNSIFDMWFYGNNGKRYSGYEAGIHLIPAVNFQNSGPDYFKDVDINTAFISDIYYNHYHPINQFWQFDMESGVEIGFLNYFDITDGFLRYKEIFGRPHLNISFTNFINSRTFFTTGIYSSYYLYTQPPSMDELAWRLDLTSNNSVKYYLSPNSTIVAELNIRFRNHTGKPIGTFPRPISNDFAHNFSISFTHSFY